MDNIFDDLEEFLDALQKNMRLLGLDIGEKTVGLAISDPGLMVASPLETIRRTKFTEDARKLSAVIDDRKVGGLVLGLPRNMDGSEGPRCQSVRQFARNLVEVAGITLPVFFWDERLSTSAIHRFLIDEADMTRKRRGEVVDKMAAGFILQGALDAAARFRSA